MRLPFLSRPILTAGSNMRRETTRWRRDQPWRASEFTDATLYARGRWPQFFDTLNGQIRYGNTRLPINGPWPDYNGAPLNYAVQYHHIVRPVYDNQSLIGAGMMSQIMDAPGGIPGKTYADYIRPGTRGDSGKVRNIAAALQASAAALYASGRKGS